MKQPVFEFIPIRWAVRNDAPTTLDVLIRITPPAPEIGIERPPLNLGLVLDRSGSMAAEDKIGFARLAASFAVDALLPTDRVSVTVFDDRVDTLVPSTPVQNKGAIADLIRQVEPGGSTALHGGWQSGAAQVQDHLLAAGLNRVILLSDGLANVGETNPDAIASSVHGLAGAGVSTSTLGLGRDYNEDLLEAMARSGDGNYYYVESPQQLPDIFRSEMQGLAATIGEKVSLGIEPGPGVAGTELLNDLAALPTGRYKLPNLVAGMPLALVARFETRPSGPELALARCRLAWDAPGLERRQTLHATLTLPAVSTQTWEAMPPAQAVVEQVALLTISRYKREATKCIERRDVTGARRALTAAREVLRSAPDTPEIQREAQALHRIEELLEGGDMLAFNKRVKYEAFRRSMGRNYENK
jgi:Ca-activated chloride channel family protein